MAKARTGEKIKIGILGGSVTKGHGVGESQRWATLYGNWWRDTFDIEVEVVNGAVGATVSEYLETCFAEHIPEDVDIVLIELAINDQRLERNARSYENLMRALLDLPNHPAVINLQVSSQIKLYRM